MASVCNHGGPGNEGSDLERCNHTVNHKSAAGELLGTWIEVRVEAAVRIECRVCGDLHGVIEKKRTTQEELHAAYLLQQRRLACPGCGEEPFLG